MTTGRPGPPRPRTAPWPSNIGLIADLSNLRLRADARGVQRVVVVNAGQESPLRSAVDGASPQMQPLTYQPARRFSQDRLARLDSQRRGLRWRIRQ